MNHRNGVGIIADEVWKKNVVEVYRSGDRVLSIKMVVEDDTINIISAYAPQIGEELFIKEQFWDELEEMIEEFLSLKRFLLVVILMDMLVKMQDNAHKFMVVLVLVRLIMKDNILLNSIWLTISKLLTLVLRNRKNI